MNEQSEIQETWIVREYQLAGSNVSYSTIGHIEARNLQAHLQVDHPGIEITVDQDRYNPGAKVCTLHNVNVVFTSTGIFRIEKIQP